jgi:uncharacterized protein DUF1801
MARTNAATVDDYLEELPDDRREVMTAMRALIRKHIPKGYRESMNWGMISYEIPLEVFPDTYNGQPFGYVALAAQKNYFALYLMGACIDGKQREALEKAFAKAGQKIDMGKSCLRFKKLSDLPLETVASVIAATPPETLIAQVRAIHSTQPKRRAKRA